MGQFEYSGGPMASFARALTGAGQGYIQGGQEALQRQAQEQANENARADMRMKLTEQYPGARPEDIENLVTAYSTGKVPAVNQNWRSQPGAAQVNPNPPAQSPLGVNPTSFSPGPMIQPPPPIPTPSIAPAQSNTPPVKPVQVYGPPSLSYPQNGKQGPPSMIQPPPPIPTPNITAQPPAPPPPKPTINQANPQVGINLGMKPQSMPPMPPVNQQGPPPPIQAPPTTQDNGNFWTKPLSQTFGPNIWGIRTAPAMERNQIALQGIAQKTQNSFWQQVSKYSNDPQAVMSIARQYDASTGTNQFTNAVQGGLGPSDLTTYRQGELGIKQQVADTQKERADAYTNRLNLLTPAQLDKLRAESGFIQTKNGQFVQTAQSDDNYKNAMAKWLGIRSDDQPALDAAKIALQKAQGTADLSNAQTNRVNANTKAQLSAAEIAHLAAVTNFDQAKIKRIEAQDPYFASMVHVINSPNSNQNDRSSARQYIQHVIASHAAPPVQPPNPVMPAPVPTPPINQLGAGVPSGTRVPSAQSYVAFLNKYHQ